MIPDEHRSRIQDCIRQITARYQEEARLTYRQPRYDEVFFYGVAWMDAMEGIGPVDPEFLVHFRGALDQRLLDLCTHPDASLHLSVAEYERWKREGHLTFLVGRTAVHDALAAAYQDTIQPRTPETWQYAQDLFGLCPDDPDEG